jgi:hypothetical protein
MCRAMPLHAVQSKPLCINLLIWFLRKYPTALKPSIIPNVQNGPYHPPERPINQISQPKITFSRCTHGARVVHAFHPRVLRGRRRR